MKRSPRLLMLLSVSLLALPACSKSKPAQEKAGNAPVSEAAPPAADLPEAEVKSLVDQWLQTQNAGDFAAYQALFAQRFEGVRRTGSKTRKLNREAWLKDRGNMFQKKMVVEIQDLAISSTPGSALVRFTQTWASGNYKDVGPKLLMVVKEGGGLKIAREEMLASTLVNDQKLPSLPLEQLSLVIQAGNKPWLLIDAAAQDAWGKGPVSLLDRDKMPMAMKQAVDSSRLNINQKGLIGRSVQLYGPSGPVCTATVRELTLLGQVIPHFGQVQTWEGTGGEPGAKASDAVVAQEAWDLIASNRWLVGALEAKGDCSQALWARGADQAPPTLVAMKQAEDPAEKRALDALRKLPAYQKILKEYRSAAQASGEKAGPSWDQVEGAIPEVRVLGGEGSGRTLISVTAQAGGGCGGFLGELWGLWEVGGSLEAPRLLLFNDPSSAPAARIQAVFDANGDGVWEMIYTYGNETGLMRFNGSRYVPEKAFQVPFLDCPC